MSNRSSNGRQAKNPWHLPRAPSVNEHNLNGLPENSEKKFRDAQQKFQEAVSKHVKEDESSSDEEETDSEAFWSVILMKYEETAGDQKLLGKTQDYLEENWLSGSPTCLICISKIRRSDQVWSCVSCYCSFHLLCIQRWSKDTIVQKKLALEEQIQIRQIKMQWDCPKCRYSYTAEEIPTNYKCYCSKTLNPKEKSFLVPHSCGETCGKPLNPFCGHSCLLLCHPGPCPPCPQSIPTYCYCGTKGPKIQRCSNRDWSCGEKCGKMLSCGKHTCVQPCHSGDCLPCPKKSIQKCLCKGNQKLRDCAEPHWQCDEICGKPLDCDNHVCEKVCHDNDCGPCDLQLPRSCPCGKTTYQLPCTEETPTCGDTCGKVLECGIHVCNQRCHKEKCGPCLETVVKSCRCGLHKKEVQCKKQYLCETKCKRMKDCNKHPCNRKCCDGNCPPCEKPCGRTLNCGNHKCNSICHQGPCYPCSQTETVSCKCGETFVTVPCGRKNKTKPPKCMKPCKLPPECHHEKQTHHLCHFGECPPCTQVCNKQLEGCSHLCSARCHTAVLVEVENKVATMPWEQVGPRKEKKALPCPNCKVPVAVTCFGKHETTDFPCHRAKPFNCGRDCGRVLLCGNHTCTLKCHIVENAEDDIQAGTNCEVCENPCTKPRNCQHPCPEQCHKGSCPPCKQMIRMKCHCNLIQLYITCSDWSVEDNRERLLNCGNQCPKMYDCGHRCKADCHSGPCVNNEGCKRKVKVYCPCKRIKKEFQCDLVRSGKAIVECDEICWEKIEEEKKKSEMLEERRRFEEEVKNRRELEKYEKMFQQRRRNRERRTSKTDDDKSCYKKYKIWILVSVLWIVLIGLVISAQ